MDDWPVVRFEPTTGQLGGAAGLVAVGLAATALLGRIGGPGEDA